MAIKLKEQGYDEITVFERGDSVGGVWRANTYPGAACDVPSHLYSFSFAPGHNWSRRYAPQDEILAYLSEVSSKFGVDPHLRLNTEVTEASFEPETGRWTVATGDGESHEFDVLVTACGQLSRPAIPPIDGIEDFRGHAFHSAEWDHEHDLRGRRVAVIGTGASAIQFVPEIAPLGRAPDHLPALGAVDPPEVRSRVPGLGATGVRALSGSGGGGEAGVVRVLRDLHLRVHGQAVDDVPGQGGRQLRAQARPRRSGAARRGRPPTTRWGASAC